ncbi:hypothetical protein ACRAWF_44945 [Streptomyces sp. L7]
MHQVTPHHVEQIVEDLAFGALTAGPRRPRQQATIRSGSSSRPPTSEP